MANTAQDVINVAASQLGYRERYSTASGTWTNEQKYSPAVPGLEWSQRQAWCATFVSWCLQTAGATGYRTSASVAVFRDYYKKENRFTEYPTLGAVAIYGVSGNVHTGIVTGWNSDSVFCIEGNTNTSGSAEGNGVYRKERPRRSSYVYGYGIPTYSGIIKSADPRWDGHTFQPQLPALPPTAPISNTTPVLPRKWVRDGITYDEDGYEFGHGSFVSMFDLSLMASHALGQSVSAESRLQAKQAVTSINALGISHDQTIRGAYSAWQRYCGYRGADADGVPGMASLTKLGQRVGLAVRR